MMQDKLLKFVEENKDGITNEDLKKVEENPITKEEFKKILKSNPMLSMLIPNKKQLIQQIDQMSDKQFQELVNNSLGFLKK